MKNKFPLILASILIMSFTGCTDKTEADRNGNDSENSSNGTSVDSGRHNNSNDMKGTSNP